MRMRQCVRKNGCQGFGDERRHIETERGKKKKDKRSEEEKRSWIGLNRCCGATRAKREPLVSGSIVCP